MIVTAECENCGFKFDLELKNMETITCPNCQKKYLALKVMNDPDNRAIIKKAERFIQEK